MNKSKRTLGEDFWRVKVNTLEKLEGKAFVTRGKVRRINRISQKVVLSGNLGEGHIYIRNMCCTT